MASCVEPMITAAAVALVEKHRAAGNELAIVTASSSFVSWPIAQRFRIPTLLATELERVGDRYTGRVLGTPTFREGKVIRLLEWLQEVGHPVAVDPDSVLRVFAEAVNWPILYVHSADDPVAVAPDPLLARR